MMKSCCVGHRKHITYWIKEIAYINKLFLRINEISQIYSVWNLLFWSLNLNLWNSVTNPEYPPPQYWNSHFPHTHNERLKVSLPHLSSWSHRAPLILQGWIKNRNIYLKKKKTLKEANYGKTLGKMKIANWGREKRIKPQRKHLGG